jgi:transposase
MEQISRIGMDTSKHIFQLHGVNTAEEPVLRKKLRRKEMLAFLEQLAPTVIAIEACGASHHCARLLQSFGHSVKLIAPQLVKPVPEARQERCGGRGSALRGNEPADNALRAGQDG